MENTVLKMQGSPDSGWLSRAEALGEAFALRAGDYDRDCRFIDENYRQLREQKFFSLAIPAAYGGGDADYATLCAVVRTLGRHCGSTGLAYAMHSHPVALNVFKAGRDDPQAIATLNKLAANELVVAGTGANDWLQSSGTAVPVDGGYRVTAHKRFVSGGPGANVFVTSAVVETEEGDQVMHFSVPFNTPGITTCDNWRTTGMRGTGSNDVIMENVFVPEAAVVVKRPAGKWHPMWDAILPVAMPLIVSCYVGLAEAAVALALKAAAGKDAVAPTVGAMHNQLVMAQLALDDMIARNNNLSFAPSVENTDAVLTRKTLATNAVRQTVEKAAEIVGGAGFFQDHPMERIVRDVRAMHFHPLPEVRQQAFSGRRALGMDPIV